jgi:cleavage and polyadenylation specificity factor subunit 3
MDQKVDSESEELKRRVEAVVEMAMTTITPLSRLFMGSGLEQVKATQEVKPEVIT